MTMAIDGVTGRPYDQSVTSRQDQATAVLSGIHVGRVAAPLREQVLEGLRNAILGFELKPGQRLVERELVEQIGVSRTTIREVLRELAAEGLVVVIPQKGAVVYAPTQEEAQELYAVRAALEALTIERFIARASEEKLEELKATLAEVERVSVDGGDIREMLRAKDHFYGVLLDGAASPTIKQILNGVQARVRLLRATSLSQPGRPQQVVVEIRALVEAIAARDVERATRLCSAHLNNAAATGISAL
jgi:DNA-binding GntR family transcriptional regulator